MDAHNPEAFIAGMVSVLCEYPEQIVFRVTDATGPLVADGDKYVPSISDVKKACEKMMQPVRDEEARARRRTETDRVLGFGPSAKDGTTQAQRTAFVERFARDNPKLHSQTYLRERLGKERIPLDEDALRDRMSNLAPLTLSAEAKAAARIPAEQEEDVQF